MLSIIKMLPDALLAGVWVGGSISTSFVSGSMHCVRNMEGMATPKEREHMRS